jgi:hypothetical protein
MRTTTNTTSLIPGKVHRRVFTQIVAGTSTATSVANTTSTGFVFGLENLPRRPNYVWAAEVLKINYYVQDNKDVTLASDDTHFVFGISTSNDPGLATWLATNTGLVNFVRRDEIIDASSYQYHLAGTSYGLINKDGEISHDVTDTLGQGILVFGDKLFLYAQSVRGTESGLFVTAEIFFRYREVALEYYLSTAQDAAASGV